MSWFMYFRESKQKFLSPNSFSTMAEINPTMSLVVEIPETRVRHVMRHNTNSVYNNCVTVLELYLNNIILYIDIYNIYYHGQKLCAPPDDIMNLKRLCRVLRRLWFFHVHINLK